jgi:hypothetical protein
MFWDPRYRGDVNQILTGEEVLSFCPWLWAFNQIWSKGWASNSGSMHPLNLHVLTKEIHDASSENIMFFGSSSNILEARQVRKATSRFDPFHRGLDIAGKTALSIVPGDEGRTVAEKIISRLGGGLSSDERVTQLVIAVDDEVADRTTHYYIYTHPDGWNSNLLPMIFEAAQDFQPTWRGQHATA